MAKDSADKPGFNIYAMLTLLTTLFLGGACYLLFDDLTNNWGFVMFGDKPTGKRAVHLTEYRDIGKSGPYVSLRKEDREDWDAIDERIKGGKEFPIKDYEWPKGFDPLKFPVQTGGAWSKTQDPQEGEKWKGALESLISTLEKEAPKEPAPEKTPEKVPETAPDAPANTEKAPDAEKVPEKAQ